MFIFSDTFTANNSFVCCPLVFCTSMTYNKSTLTSFNGMFLLQYMTFLFKNRVWLICFDTTFRHFVRPLGPSLTLARLYINSDAQSYQHRSNKAFITLKAFLNPTLGIAWVGKLLPNSKTINRKWQFNFKNYLIQLPSGPWFLSVRFWSKFWWPDVLPDAMGKLWNNSLIDYLSAFPWFWN